MASKSRNPIRISSKSVFEVDRARLAIGVFNRPLLDAECRRLRRAWERQGLPGFEDFQVDKNRVSFVARPEDVSAAWSSIDRLLASTTENVKKAS
ncbi:MAG TPA: hypothetical protein VLO07_08890 [Thermoanaerobaculia bacterium]|nr:hypothetical protein [Thermoanaerobaculia bacterium]